MKVSDKDVREYLLKNELNKFFSTSDFEVVAVEEKSFKLEADGEYNIKLSKDFGLEYIYYNTREQYVFQKDIKRLSVLSVDYMKKKLNEFIKLEATLKKFFKERK